MGILPEHAFDVKLFWNKFSVSALGFKEPSFAFERTFEYAKAMDENANLAHPNEFPQIFSRRFVEIRADSRF